MTTLASRNCQATRMRRRTPTRSNVHVDTINTTLYKFRYNNYTAPSEICLWCHVINANEQRQKSFHTSEKFTKINHTILRVFSPIPMSPPSIGFLS